MKSKIAISAAAVLAAGAVATMVTATTSAEAAHTAQSAHVVRAIDPAQFQHPRANAYFPLRPGTVFRYRGRDGSQHFTEKLAVTHRTKMIQGVRTRVLSDVLRRHDGSLAEKTSDWYAADNDGNVWYFGERTATYDRNGHVQSREGSWRAGVGGAVAGRIMPHDPRPTDAYRQELRRGAAEDQAWIVQRGFSAKVPYGTVHHVVRSLEWSRLEKGGVGEVLRPPSRDHPGGRPGRRPRVVPARLRPPALTGRGHRRDAFRLRAGRSRDGGSMTQQATPARIGARQMLNKVPEVTIWFWVIKILCTTVGESFADWINMTLGVGLINTAILFTVIFAAVLAVQMKLRQYVPFAYWLTVVVVSVTGTLYTDILTDQLGVPLWISTTVFSVLLAAVFGIWYARERTLSIHTIVTVPRESFYWLAILVTFALGTAAGDWTLELTGWGPGKSVLLPLALIGIVTLVWRLGANEVLTFWLAYILTRPLGANIGDWLATPTSEKGLGLGTFVTSLVFLGAILATVVYLSVSRADVIENEEDRSTGRYARPERERPLFGVLVAVSLATVGLLAWANQQPHASALEAEGPAPSCSGSPLDQAQATQQVASKFPASSVDNYRAIAKDTLQLVDSGDQSGAKSRVTDLETAWDNDQDSLQPKDCQAWTYVDQQIDPVLSAVRASNPDKAKEQQALNALLTTLG